MGRILGKMVQAVKRSLHKVLFRAAVTYEELLTVVVEIEGIVNSRPLTYIYNEIEDVITPSHLFMGKRLLSQNSENVNDDEDPQLDTVKITKRMAYLKSLTEHYWQRFQKEYLLELRMQHVQGTDPIRKVETGEVVVVHGKAKRNHWRLGKVISFIPGSDEQIRAVVLKVFDGTKARYMRRPIEKLYPLEVKAVTTVDNTEVENAKKATDEINTYENMRPERQAAKTGLLVRRLLGNT